MGIMRQEGLRGAFLPNRKQKLEMVKSRNAPRPVRRHFIVYEYEGGKFCMIGSWHKPYRGVTCHTFLLRKYHLSGQCTAPRKPGCTNFTSKFISQRIEVNVLRFLAVTCMSIYKLLWPTPYSIFSSRLVRRDP